jgi:osmoprotectant transport system permease protein
VWQYIDDRRVQILINAWNHAYLVVLAIILGTVIAIAIAMVVTRIPRLEPAVNALSAIGLTIPSFALIGLLLPVTGLGAPTALLAVTLYAAWPASTPTWWSPRAAWGWARSPRCSGSGCRSRGR